MNDSFSRDLPRALYRRRRIVGAGWLRGALAPKASISDGGPYAEGYGYSRYSKVQQIKVLPVSFPPGNGGNTVYVVPSRHMVVAMTSSAYGSVELAIAHTLNQC